MVNPPKNAQRRLIGMYISGGGGKVGLTYAHAIYELTWLDGNTVKTVVERGHDLRVLMDSRDMNGTKKQKALHAITLRPEFESHIRAASVLMNDIEKACVEIDDKLREEYDRKG